MTLDIEQLGGFILHRLGRILKMHWLLFAMVMLLSIAGVFFINSAVYSAYLSDHEYFKGAAMNQARWIGIGLVAYFFFLMIDYRILPKFGLPMLLIACLLVVYTQLTQHKVNGARSWLPIPGTGVTLQPAELVKISYICALTQVLIFLRPRIKRLSTICIVGVMGAIPFFLVLQAPDLGSASVLVPTTLLALWGAGARKRYLMLPILGLAAIFAFCYFYIHKEGKHLPFLKTYQENRIRIFFDPTLDRKDAGWTITQSLIAEGSGGLLGKGYMKGDQNIYGFLPKNIAYNDFIFSVIAEEEGFVGGSLVIISEAVLLLCVITIAFHATDFEGVVLACAFVGMLLTHFFVNVGMTMKVVPITGIPLPFISYGGTFMVACMAGMGIVQSIWIERQRRPIA